MDPISIAAIISMIGGAYMQNRAVQQQAQRQRDLAMQMQQRQMQAQDRATKVATQEAENFDPAKRKAAQDAIQQEMTGEFQQAAQQPAVTAQGVQVGASIPQGQGGSDYTAAQAREAAKTAASMHQLAGLMGRIGAPSLMRQREAVGIGDAAGAIGRIQTGANNMAGIDKVGIDTVTPNPWMTIGGQALSAYGMGTLASAGAAGQGAKHITQTPSLWING